MKIRLTDKVFIENYKNSQSAEYKQLENELVTSVS